MRFELKVDAVVERVRAKVKGAVLAWARESAAYSVDDAAKRVNTTPERLASWEADEAAPTINQLRLLAQAYKRPLSVFYLQEVPAKFMVMKDFRRLPGAGGRHTTPQLAYEMRVAQQRRSLALELLDDIGVAAPPFRLSATMNDDPEQTGTVVRDALRVSYADQTAWRQEREAFNGWRRRIEALGVLVFQATRAPSDEVSGIAIYEDVLPVVVINKKDTVTRRTFSLLHEFVHLLIRQTGVSDLDIDADRPPEEQAIEVFCNRVAAAALMPRDRFLQEGLVTAHPANQPLWSDDEIAALARIYGVSREAVVRRLLTFGRTTDAFYREKRAQYGAEFAALRAREREQQKDQDFQRNPSQEALSDFGRPFVRLVLDNYAQERITLSDVSGYLGVRVKHVAKIENAIGMG